MRVEEALEAYLLQLQADGRSVHTSRQVRRHVSLLARWAAESGLSGEIEAFGPPEVARFMASPTARTGADGAPKSASSVNCLRSSLRTFFGHLHQAGVLQADPARLLRRAICAPSPPRCLAEEDCHRLLGVLSAGSGDLARRDHALFHLMLASGIRVGSAVSVEARDIDLKRGELYLREAKQGRPVRVLLGDGIRDHLARYLHGREAGPLFPGRSGGAMTPRNVARRLAHWSELAGIGHIHPHRLRHSFGAHIYRRTGDLLLVRAALHHRSLSSTLIYAHASEAALRSALQTA